MLFFMCVLEINLSLTLAQQELQLLSYLPSPRITVYNDHNVWSLVPGLVDWCGLIPLPLSPTPHPIIFL